MAERLFGTDGIRGTSGEWPINLDGAWRLGRAVAEQMGEAGSTVFVGRDPRPWGAELSESVIAGLTAGGCDAVDLGVVPTPAVAHFVEVERAPAGIAISASHNPAGENGFKLFGPGGEKVCPSVERLIERLFPTTTSLPRPAQRGRARLRLDAIERYVAAAVSTMPPGCDLRGLSIAVDCARGATRESTPMALSLLGAEVIAVGNEDQGERINDGCGSLHPDYVRAAKAEHRADIGLAHDGDGDRLLVIDEDDQIVCGDRILGIAAQALQARGELTGQQVVGTVLSNIGLEHWLGGIGCRFHRSDVGDRNVWLMMREHGAALGGEPSGHTIFRRFAPTDDALISAIQVLAEMQRSGRRLSDLAAAIPLVPQRVANLRVSAKPSIDSIPVLRAAREQADGLLGRDGRVIVRYSGTESVARILAEGPDDRVLGQVVSLFRLAFTAAGIAA